MTLRFRGNHSYISMVKSFTKAFLERLQANPAHVLEGLDVATLAKLVDAAADAYYNTSTPLLPDDLFDLAKDTLAKRDPNNPAIRRVGAPIRGEKVTLPYWMGSLDKIRDDPKQLQKWKAKYGGQVVVSDKLDGNSAMLVYAKDGGMKMYSRGDGEYGQDISHLVTMIRGIPPPNGIPSMGLAVRGELIISRKNWETIQHLGANARNVVAGTMNAKQPNPEIAHKIEFVAYEMLKPKTLAPSGTLDALESMRFTVAHHEVLTDTSLTMDALSEILVRRRRDSPYEVDGIVVEHDEIHKSQKGKNPVHAFAFKSILTHEEAEVLVKEVEWNVSKDGFLKPTVIFDPVVIAGVKIQRATGFNGSFIEKNVIGPGARIVVIRSGDVIPFIVRVIAPASNKQPSMPDVQYEWSDTHIDIMIRKGAASDQMELKRMEHFVATLDIKNVAGGTLKRLYDQGFNTLGKLFALTEKDVLKIEGFKEASAKRIIDGFQKAKASASCTDMMVASNIFGRGLGKKKIQMITAAIPQILEGYTPSMEEMLKIKGTGEETAKSFLGGLKEFFKLMEELGIPCRKPPSPTKTVSSPRQSLEGKTFVFTGFRNADWEKKIEERGGKMASTVSSKTSYVVASDPNEDSTKLKKARDLGIVILSREEFQAMI